MMASKDLF